jgi:quercetin dioxygenase-like cupin family protein
MVRDYCREQTRPPVLDHNRYQRILEGSNERTNMQVISARNMQLREDTERHFTGYVQQQKILKVLPPTIDVLCVFFAPNARTHWHSHPEGQVLYVVSGRDRCGSTPQTGGEMCEIGPGDVVHFDKDELHWHGAAPDCFMTHLAVTPHATSETDKWYQQVTDEEYNLSPQFKV